MKRLQIMEISRSAIRLSIVMLLVSVTGCERLNTIEMRLDTVDRRMVTLNEKIEAHDTDAKSRSDKNDSAIHQLDDKLTKEIMAYDTASKKRSAENEAAIHQLDNKLTSHIASQRQELDQSEEKLGCDQGKIGSTDTGYQREQRQHSVGPGEDRDGL